MVVLPVINMHSAARRNADVVSQARLGEEVEMIRRREAWRRIKTADGYEGWVENKGLRTLKDTRYPASGAKSVTVESLFAHIYPEPSVTRRAPRLTAPYESVLEVVKDHNERWIQVRLPNNDLGFVQRGDVVSSRNPQSVPELITHARRFLGFPYMWGGTSSYGYDCSGFTQMLCRRGGVIIPRDAKPQAHWDVMAPVDREALEPGDLLYFGPSMDKINHTGFYIGGGEFIHSTTNTRPIVQVSRLDEEHWSKLFVCARRWKKQS